MSVLFFCVFGQTNHDLLCMGVRGMDQEIARKWFSHTGDLRTEHIDEPDGRMRLYFLTSMADAKSFTASSSRS